MVTLGDRVNKGQVLAYISSPLGHEEITMNAPKDGIVIGQQTLPLVNEGDAVFHLAYFTEDNDEVGEKWKVTSIKSLSMSKPKKKVSLLALLRCLIKTANKKSL